MNQVRRPQFGRKGQAQHRPCGLPELPEPAGAPRAQKRQKDHELQGGDELLGGRKLALLAGLFEALLGRLLGFSGLVRHGASYT